MISQFTAIVPKQATMPASARRDLTYDSMMVDESFPFNSKQHDTCRK
jgi:hypothetical protein